MAPTTRWLSAASALAASLISAVVYLATNDWFGARDLHAMAIWSLPLSILVFFGLGLLPRAPTRPWLIVTLLPVAGLVTGVAWYSAAALLLGGWIFAFSFPVIACWTFGGVTAGIVAGCATAPRTWPLQVAVLITASAALGRFYSYAQAPEPRFDVLIRSQASEAEVDLVWRSVLGRPGRSATEHALLPEISGITRMPERDGHKVLRITVWKHTSAGTRDSLIRYLATSPLISRIEPIPKSDRRGLRQSVSY